MEKDARIFVAGHRGLAGSALTRALKAAGYTNLVLRSRQELDLRQQQAVQDFFEAERPHYVFLAAARVGGIQANKSQPVEFLLENLRIQNNVIESSYRSGVEKLLFLGTSCIYPRLAEQPIREEALLTGPLEPTNEAYAIAKIAGLRLTQYYQEQYGARFISAMPTNLYGPNDNFDPQTSHALPGMMGRFHQAKLEGKDQVTVWGTGNPYRELLHVDDLADACLFLMLNYEGSEILNVGTGRDMTIRELAETVQRVVGFEGELFFDTSKPDGMPRKQLDVARMTALGWVPKISLEEGIRDTYRWFLDNIVSA